MILVRLISLSILALAASCASPSANSLDMTSSDSSDFGVLVMAHGGAPEWNEGVLAAVKPLEDQTTIEVAFGMADAVSMQAAVGRLEARGAKRIGVVRLFVSGESWFGRTQKILGVRAGAPDRPAMDIHAHEAGHDEHGGHSMEFWRADTEASFALSTEGLAQAEAMGAVLLDRARDLSSDPQREDVLVLAHGPGDDAENRRWLEYINARAAKLRSDIPFRHVQVMTLREDWPDKRREAEDRIRSFVERAKAEGGVAIVIPFRVHGFGPYSRVLEGLDYLSDGRGLVPHPSVTQWIAQQIELLRTSGFDPQIN